MLAAFYKLDGRLLQRVETSSDVCILGQDSLMCKSVPETVVHRAPQVALVLKNPPASGGEVRDAGFIPGCGGSPGGGHHKPLQYACLENLLDRGA